VTPRRNDALLPHAAGPDGAPTKSLTKAKTSGRNDDKKLAEFSCTNSFKTVLGRRT
jgi:hypothetical protein